ncbi:Ger(x)C family spore germination C-terminal domain-containing protein [Paenibacillus sp. HJGM_3]|uniref:Ger(x)C family spore germination protein n=1 Tax=Paenibacillus sp. HJGM_3 TaxID=3379816 RepID=UPI00385F5062
MKRVSLFTLCLCLIVPLTGCWDIVEIRHDAFLIGMGIDQVGENRIELSLLELDIPPSTSGKVTQTSTTGNPYRTRLFSSQGASLAECMDEIQEKIDNRFTLEKITFIVFGKTAAQKGLSEHWDYLFREFDLDPSLHLLVAEGQAQSLLAQEKGILVEFINEKFDVVPNFLDMLLWRFTPAIFNPLESSYIPTIDFAAQKLHYTGVGLFTDSRMTLALNAEDQKIVNLFVNKEVNEILLYSDETKKTAFQVSQEKRRIKLAPEGARISIRLKGMLTQSAMPSTPNHRIETEKAIAARVQQSMVELYGRMQQEGVDLFGLGERRRQRGLNVSNWEREFKTFPVTFEVTVQILSGSGKME